jgi:TPR repeat protein
MRLPLAALCLALSFAPAVAQTVEDGFEAYDAGDYATAKTILLPLAEAGDARAMRWIGNMYYFGKGFPENATTACDWYEKAAIKGFATAQSNLGICFGVGHGRPLDPNAEIFWKEKAAAQGDLHSQLDLVQIYRTSDIAKAAIWGREAVKSGAVAARVIVSNAHVSYDGPPATWMERMCFMFANVIFDSDLHACDRVMAFLASPL